ncbi:hypothetical protein BC938DRAFT_478340 [Jimgerdemannia flammicorona]|nr:hypothetical protein BC938DRAFT_478340 [Jimgerdemannia flammicorona]
MAYLERLKPHLPLELFENFVHGRGIGIIAKSVSCKYKQVVEFPDTLAIATKINNMLPDRFTMSVIAVSHKTETIVAEGAVVVVAYDYRKKDKTLVPEEIVRVVETLEAEANERIANN